MHSPRIYCVCIRTSQLINLCVLRQLEEEAGLVGGTWVPLLQDISVEVEEAEGEGVGASTEAGHLSLGHDKYSTERFFPFLVINPKVRCVCLLRIPSQFASVNTVRDVIPQPHKNLIPLPSSSSSSS